MGEDIADITLNTPHRNVVPMGYQKIAEITLDSKQIEYLNVLSKMELFHIKNNNEKFERQIDYKYLTTRQKEIITYTNVFSKDNLTLETIENKNYITEEYWEDFNFKDVKKGVYTIGLFMQVNYMDEIEWVPTFYGVRNS